MKLQLLPYISQFTQLILISAPDLLFAASGLGGHGDHYCQDGVPTEAALLAILAAFAVSFALLYMASTTNMARRKRDIAMSYSDMFKDVLWGGKSFLDQLVDV